MSRNPFVFMGAVVVTSFFSCIPVIGFFLQIAAVCFILAAWDKFSN